MFLGIGVRLGALGGFSPLSLFAANEDGAWYEPSDLSTLFQDSAGTTPVTTAGQPVGLTLDKTDNTYNALQATSAARPTYVVASNGDSVLQNDEIDDALAVTFPNMGIACTVAFVTQGSVYLEEDITLNGAYTLPQRDLLGFVAIDRALTVVEKIQLIRYLASKSQGVTYGVELGAMALAAISAVDVFVYDTSLDSDGGAWINGSKARASSWYNETLNTATRGATRAFPAQAMIIAEAAKVTIYDATDPDLPMWMVFNRSAGNPLYFDASATISSLSMINGLMMVGQADSAGVLSYFSMLADRAYLKVNSAPVYNDVTIANRNRGGTLTTYSTDSGAIVNRIVNDVAMTVLADAPIDAATGLQVPTIAVATNGGTSVINNDGTVIDLTLFSRAINKVTFDESGNGLWVASGRNAVHYYETLPTSDSSSEPAIRLITSGYSSPNIGGGFLGDAIEAIEGGAAISSTLLGLVNFLPYGSSSLTGGSMLSYGASTYNTGWMHGDIKGAWLSSVDATDLVNGGTDPDRSVNATDLDVTGTITKTAVANGAELMAYSGFSASNYLEQPYNSDLDFGTGDFHVMWWAKATDATAYMIHRFDATAYFRSRFSSGVIEFRTTGGNISTPDAYNDGAWHLVCGVRSSGVLSLYVDGVVRNSVADTANLDDATASLSIGVSSVQTSALTNGSLALLRIGAGAPTAAQVLKAYNDELPLFQENGAATIFGASNAVTALAHDPDTDLLHVGTSAGRSVFRGLERINNTSTSISTAISASGGLIVEK